MSSLLSGLSFIMYLVWNENQAMFTEVAGWYMGQIGLPVYICWFSNDLISQEKSTNLFSHLSNFSFCRESLISIHSETRAHQASKWQHPLARKVLFLIFEEEQILAIITILFVWGHFDCLTSSKHQSTIRILQTIQTVLSMNALINKENELPRLRLKRLGMKGVGFLRDKVICWGSSWPGKS